MIVAGIIAWRMLHQLTVLAVFLRPNGFMTQNCNIGLPNCHIQVKMNRKVFLGNLSFNVISIAVIIFLICHVKGQHTHTQGEAIQYIWRIHNNTYKEKQILHTRGEGKVGESCGQCYCPETVKSVASCGCLPSLNAGECSKGLICSGSKEGQQILYERSITGDFIFDQLKLTNPAHLGVCISEGT